LCLKHFVLIKGFTHYSTKTTVFALNGSDIFNSKACVVLP
jgi:hypothetical protein